jgi:hypothetical protein
LPDEDQPSTVEPSVRLIAICGVGALGSVLAVLCRNFDAKLRLIDFDRVEPINLPTQAYGKPSIGQYKAVALAQLLADLYGVEAEERCARLTPDNAADLLGGADLLVDCFDNYDSRKALADFADEADVELVHAGLSVDGSFGLVRWSQHFVPDREPVEEHATCERGEQLPMIGLLGATLARTIQDYLARGEQYNSVVGMGGASRT